MDPRSSDVHLVRGAKDLQRYLFGHGDGLNYLKKLVLVWASGLGKDPVFQKVPYLRTRCYWLWESSYEKCAVGSVLRTDELLKCLLHIPFLKKMFLLLQENPEGSNKCLSNNHVRSSAFL